MHRRFKIPIIIILTAVLTQAAGYAVRAALPEALLTAGSTRYAAAYYPALYTVSYTGDWQDLTGMTKYITIPTGQTADVFVSFCALLQKGTAASVSTRALLRSEPASPPGLEFVPATTPSNQCADYFWTNVSAGQPPIKIQMYVTPATNVYVQHATMLVTVNLH